MSSDNMPTESYPASEPADRLDAILADYLQQLEEGCPPNRELLVERHPELAQELREFFADRDLMRAQANRLRYIVPKFLGDYQLLEELGTGTFGIVVKAQHVQTGHLAAIKLLRGEQWSSKDYVKRFRTEAQKAAKLDHPHLVPVYHLGEVEGQPYYVMKLIEGGSLTQRLRACTGQERATRRHQRWAAELVVKIAQAVHYAHQHAVIHRDLKPGNILLDTEGQPHITDFGLAKQLEEGELLLEFSEAGSVSSREHFTWEGGPEADTILTEKGLIAGTAPYMSPEQGAGQDATSASDVYSLGVILYEMLAGQVPIRGATPQETMRLIQHQSPPLPRSLNSRIDHRLEKICLKCLDKDPQKRYGSALGLARSLERWLGNEPIIDPPDSFVERCRLWCRRNPVVAGLGTTAALLLLVVTVLTVGHLAREAGRREEILEGNIYMAQGVAARFLLQLEKLSGAVEQTAVDKRLLDLLERDDKPGLKTFFEGIHAHYDDPRHGIARAEKDPPFESWYCLNYRGNLLALTGGEGIRQAALMKAPNYQGRDYFHGAMRRAGKKGREAVHISRIYEATTDGLFRFGISAPVYKGEKVVGVVVATVITDRTMGLDRLHDNRRKAVLYGPKDSDPPREKVSRLSPPSEFVILVHPAYHRGIDAVTFPAGKPPAARPLPDVEALHQPDPQQAFTHEELGMKDYVDPVGARDAEFEGRWLAGFAPVGNTELVVIVQQHYDDAIAPDRGIIWSGVAVLLGILFIVAIGWFVLQAFPRPRG